MGSENVNVAWQMLRHFGPRWLSARSLYILKRRSGWLRCRQPATSWNRHPLDRMLRDRGLSNPEDYLAYRRDSAPSFFFSVADRQKFTPLLSAWGDEVSGPVSAARQLREGCLRYFSGDYLHVGYPPNWHANPLTGQTAPGQDHWSQINDFHHGDIKMIWEPSRFAFAYDLVRAYWRDGDAEHAETFWQLVESWRDANPPNHGPNWKCGQEASVRLMAWCFGFYGFLDAPATTPERAAMLAQMIALTGRRIESNLQYALSQYNNHGVSEGAGLWTAGLLFPELVHAPRWRALGRDVLDSLARELIYDDGAFSQHSVNYHRMMLHGYVWSLRLGRISQRLLSQETSERVARAGQLLYQLQDVETGRLPNYGANDGAMMLPLNNCDSCDYRPVVQATQLVTSGSRCYEPGAWDEDLLWLVGPSYQNVPIESPRRTDLAAEVGGYYTLRSRDGFAFFRCARFRHRPGQADMLHVDIWWRGQNIALDAGTYSYNAPAPWDGPLARTEAHNTVGIDGLDQMQRAGRFLWLPWLTGQLTCRQQTDSGHLAWLSGRHDGYRRLRPALWHRRGLLRLGSEHWLICDQQQSSGEHRHRLHWLLTDVPHQWDPQERRLTLKTPAGDYCLQLATRVEDVDVSLVRADVKTPRGWRAPTYGAREQALSLALKADGEMVRFWTLLGPPPCAMQLGTADVQLEAGSLRARLQFGDYDDEGLISRAELQGPQEDELVIAS